MKPWHEGPGPVPGLELDDTRWIRIEGTRREEYRLSHRLHSGAELSSLAKEAGFSRVSVFGSLAGDPYDNNARRLVLVGQK